MWLRHGRVEMFGPTHEVVSCYEKETTHKVVSHYEKQTAEHQQATQPEPLASLSHWSVHSKLSTDLHTIISGQARVTFRFEIEMASIVPDGLVSVSVADVQGLILFTQEGDLRQIKAGKISLTLELPFLPLKPGEYIVTCTISDRKHPVAFLRATPELRVLEEKSSERSGYHGILNLPAKLSVEEGGMEGSK
jgi:hypothetical protein